MKWYKPKTGTERTVRKFAWWPTKLDDENSPVVWLEFYYAREFYGYSVFWASYRWTEVTKTQDTTKLDFWDDEDKKHGWGEYSKNTI